MVARTSFSNSSAGSGCGRKDSKTEISCFSLAANSARPPFSNCSMESRRFLTSFCTSVTTSASGKLSVLRSICTYPRADFNMRNAERRSASLASIAVLISWESWSCKLMSLFRGFEIAQGVAHLGGLFVILVVDGFVQRPFELLPLAQRALGVNFLQPVLQIGDFTAVFERFTASMFLVKLPN